MQRARTKPKTAKGARLAKTGLASARKAPLPPKLTSPRADRLYPRERLFELLDRTREDHRVIWVSAPGGAGKTSLAASYITSRKLPVLWYQVDPGDGDIASFFYYMGLAAKQAAPRFKKPLPVLTPEYLGDVPTFTRNFFRELYRRLPGRAVIVLDNYQDAPEDSGLHDVLHTAMHEVPRGMNLLVLSRVEPPSVLARLRLCDHAACLDWDKMRLTPEETAGLGALRSGREPLDGRTVDVLQQRTQGWAAGVVLMLEQAHALNALDAAPVPAGQALLFDYFAGEVLHRGSPETQAFLLKTALFPKVTAAQAHALTGHAHARDILEDLTRRNYFTVRHVAPEDTYYEYHPLFREFLLECARKQFSPEQLAVLKQHAARLLAAAGNAEAAEALLTQAQDWQGLIPVVLQHAPNLARQGRLQTLAHWLHPLPEPLLDAVPWLRYWLGVCTLGMNAQQAIAHFNAAYEGFDHDRDATGALLSWAGVVNAVVFEGQDYGQLDPWLARLTHLRTTYPEFPSAEVEMQVTAAALVGLMWRSPAHPSTAYWFRHAMEISRTCPDPRARVLLGFYYYSSGIWHFLSSSSKILEIEEYLVGLIPQLEGAPFEQALCYYVQLWHLCYRPQSERALRVMEQALATADRSGVHVMDFMIVGEAAAACLGVGDLTRADELLTRMQALEGSRPKLDHTFYWYLRAWRAALGREFERARDDMAHALDIMKQLKASSLYMRGLLAWAEYQIACGDVAPAHAALVQAEEQLSEVEAGMTRLQYDMVATQLAFAAGDEALGLECLRRWLELTRRSGMLCVVSSLPEPAARLCARALTHGIEVETARAIIRQRRLTPPDDTLPEHWPWQLRFYTFGRFSVVKDDAPLKTESKGSRKPMELLKALIAFGGREVSEQRLSGALWPDADGGAAHQAFATTLHRLRKLIGAEEWLRLEGNHLTLDTRYVWVDAWAFERDLTRASNKGLVSFERAFALYNGPFLGAQELPFALPARERLRSRFLRAVTERGGLHEQAENHDQAIACYQRGLEVDPLAEDFYRRLMHCYRRQHRRAEALAVYQRCHQTLTALLGVPPSPETQSLYKDILSTAQ